MHEEGDGLTVVGIIAILLLLLAWMFMFSVFILTGWAIGLVLIILSIKKIKDNYDYGEPYGGWIVGLIAGIIILLLGLRFILDTEYRVAALDFMGRLFS